MTIAAVAFTPSLASVIDDGLGSSGITFQYNTRFHKALDGYSFLPTSALNRLFPAFEKNSTPIVSGATFDSGFLAGKERYSYSKNLPVKYLDKRSRLTAIAEKV